MQQLNDDLGDVDLDAAYERTMTRHRELVHERNVRRRWITGGVCAVVIAAGAILVPQLGDDGQRVQLADEGGAAATTTVPAVESAPDAYQTTQEGEVTVLTRVDGPTTSVPVTGDAGVGDAATSSRGVAVASVESVPGSEVVYLHFECQGRDDHVDVLRYRVDGERVLVDAEVRSTRDPAACAAGAPGASITVTLPAAWRDGMQVIASAV